METFARMTALANTTLKSTVLKNGSKSSFTPRKLQFLAIFCLVFTTFAYSWFAYSWFAFSCKGLS